MSAIDIAIEEGVVTVAAPDGVVVDVTAPVVVVDVATSGPPGADGTQAVIDHEAEPDPHDQYLLSAGDTATGNLRINELVAGLVYDGGFPGIQARQASAVPATMPPLVMFGTDNIYLISGGAGAGSAIALRPRNAAAKQWTWDENGCLAQTPLALPGDPVAALHAAPKQYVDGLVAAHAAAADPHPAYLTQVEGDGRYVLGPESSALNNTGFGVNSIGAGVTGNANTALGRQTLTAVVAGAENVAVGYYAQSALVGGLANVAVGCLAHSALTSGQNNVAIGAYSHGTLTTGTNNLAVGRSAGANLSTANSHTAMGASSGAYAAGTGNESTSLGYSARAHTGATALGARAEARGIYSTAIGLGAIATLDNQIMLGAAAHRVYVNNDPVAALEVATKQYADTKWKAWTGTQAAYTALGTYDPGTLYCVV